jgi:hypothetical protein
LKINSQQKLKVPTKSIASKIIREKYLMALTEKQQQVMLNNQVAAWVAELRRESVRLAGLITAATGKHHAVVMVSGTDDDYADVIPELILDDVLRVTPHGWPEGFDIQLLNPASA